MLAPYDYQHVTITPATTLYRHWSKATPGKPSIIKQLKMFSQQAELAVLLKKKYKLC